MRWPPVSAPLPHLLAALLPQEALHGCRTGVALRDWDGDLPRGRPSTWRCCWACWARKTCGFVGALALPIAALRQSWSTSSPGERRGTPSPLFPPNSPTARLWPAPAIAAAVTMQQATSAHRAAAAPACSAGSARRAAAAAAAPPLPRGRRGLRVAAQSGAKDVLERAADRSSQPADPAFDARAFRRSLNSTGRYTRKPSNDPESLQLMEEHGVGYSTSGLVAQMREQGNTWKQARRGCGGRAGAGGWALVAAAPTRRAAGRPCRAGARVCGGGVRGGGVYLNLPLPLPLHPLSTQQGDVTVKLAEAYGFCWGVERAVQVRPVGSESAGACGAANRGAGAAPDTPARSPLAAPAAAGLQGGGRACRGCSLARRVPAARHPPPSRALLAPRTTSSTDPPTRPPPTCSADGVRGAQGLPRQAPAHHQRDHPQPGWVGGRVGGRAGTCACGSGVQGSKQVAPSWRQGYRLACLPACTPAHARSAAAQA